MFISQLKPDDPYHSEALLIANGLRKGEVHAETSVLTMVETASVASRMYYHAMGSKASPDERKTFVTKTIRMLAGVVKFVHMEGDSPIPLGSIRPYAPSIFSESILLSTQTTLRTLDLMHVVAARHARKNNGELGAFVTGDEDLLLLKEQLSKIAGMPFLSPREYVHGLGLK